jgi:Dyp-type peroxidase family
MSNEPTTANETDNHEPLIAVDEIQGNVLPGFLKDHMMLLGLRIDDPQAAKAWIRSMTPDVSTAREVYAFKRLRNLLKLRRASTPTGLKATWLNISFSAQGLSKLIGDAEVNLFEDGSFKVGLHERSKALSDPQDAASKGAPSNWLVGGSPETVPDVLLIIAGDDPKDVSDKVVSVRGTLDGASGLSVHYEEVGRDPGGNLRGHEHFGFKDGISQPGVRGRMPDAPFEFITPRIIREDDPRARFLSAPGQPLVRAGHFVFGYATQDPLDPESDGRELAHPAWAKNGSFLVYRRLRQDVKSFWDFLEQKAAELAAKPGYAGLTAESLGAMLVGRWPNGAPIMRTLTGSEARLATDPYNNHFNFINPNTPISFTPASRFSADTSELAPGDEEGRRCPMASHIRKVNPRDATTDQGSATDTFTRRILRRGLPFGPTLKREDFDNPDPIDGDRGLLFFCYQTSIEMQFEFLTRTWMNEDDAPEEGTSGPGGHDLLVGQQPDTRRRLRKAKIFPVSGHGDPAVIEVAIDWILPTGGGYFFTPSISALTGELTR